MDFLPLRLGVGRLDDLEELLLNVLPEDAARYLPEELLQDAGYRVHAEVVHVDEPARLQEVRELLHRALVAGRPEHVLSVWSLLVQLEN